MEIVEYAWECNNPLSRFLEEGVLVDVQAKQHVSVRDRTINKDANRNIMIIDLVFMVLVTYAESVNLIVCVWCFKVL